MTPPPPPPPSSTPTASSRYVYLLTRLRNRQITMEEATELFAIMQAMIRAAPSAPPPPPPPSDDGSIAPAPVTAAGITAWSGDADWLLILGLGAAAGLGTAVMKVLRDGPGPRRTDPPTKSSG